MGIPRTKVGLLFLEGATEISEFIVLKKRFGESAVIKTGECTSCGDCCRTVNITAVRDITLKQHGNLEELKRYLAFRGHESMGELPLLIAAQLAN